MVKSKTTWAAPRWNQALPGRSPTKTGSAAVALPLKNAATSLRPSICRGVPTQDRSVVGSTAASGASSVAAARSRRLGCRHEGVHHFPVGEAVIGRGLGDLRPRPRGQLAGRYRRRVEERGDRRELEAEAVVEHEGDPLARGEPVEDDVQRKADGVGERDVVGRIGRGLPGSTSSTGMGVRERSRSRHSRVVTVVSQAGRLSMSASVVCIRSHACWTTSWASVWSPSTRLAIPTRRGRSASNMSVWSTTPPPFRLPVTVLVPMSPLRT